jgi:hypothetical protein
MRPESAFHTASAVPQAVSEPVSPAMSLAVPRHWAVFHPLPGAGALVVGPGGIFTVSVRDLAGGWAWADKRGLLVSGRRVMYMAEAEREAERVFTLLQARMALPARVCAVLALDGTRHLGPRERALPVKVLALEELEMWLAGLPTVLRAIERMELAAVIDSPVTWGMRPTFGQGPPPTPSPPRPHG